MSLGTQLGKFFRALAEEEDTKEGELRNKQRIYGFFICIILLCITLSLAFYFTIPWLEYVVTEKWGFELTEWIHRSLLWIAFFISLFWVLVIFIVPFLIIKKIKGSIILSRKSKKKR